MKTGLGSMTLSYDSLSHIRRLNPIQGLNLPEPIANTTMASGALSLCLSAPELSQYSSALNSFGAFTFRWP